MGLILSQEDPLEEEVATHSSVLVWTGAWWAPVHGVAKSQIGLNTHIFQRA